MFINAKRREVNVKIVYYGPGLAGKTTNLQYIHGHTNPRMRSDLISLKTRGERTLFFDFLQLELGEVKGLKPRFSLYTVPGQTYYAASRKLVLQGVDGVVLVLDSRRDRLADNRRSTAALERDLKQMHRQLEDFPLVLQCNKQDMPNALAPEVLKAQLGWNGTPCFASVATLGLGVLDTLKAIIHQVMYRLEQASQGGGGVDGSARQFAGDEPGQPHLH